MIDSAIPGSLDDSACAASRRDGALPASRREGATRGSGARVVHHGGNQYVATAAMVAIFLNRVRALQGSGRSELVVLPHRGGVDLLFVAPSTPIEVTEIDIDRAPAPVPVEPAGLPQRHAV